MKDAVKAIRIRPVFNNFKATSLKKKDNGSIYPFLYFILFVDCFANSKKNILSLFAFHIFRAISSIPGTFQF